MNEWLRDLPMAEYLTDRSRSSGSSLRMAGSEPERYGAWIGGASVDKQTAATAQGSLCHLLALGRGSGDMGDFAFYPDRTEALTEEKVMGQPGPRGGKPKLEKTGKFVPQDASDAGRHKKAFTGSDFEKAEDRKWRAAHEGKIIVMPESQPIVQAMARAIRRDPHASALLVGPEYEPEVTGHYMCPEQTGRHTSPELPCRVRLDGLRLGEDTIIELKTITPANYGRLDTSNPAAVMRWAREGYAIKSAMGHDAFFAIEGRNCTLIWILVEAVAAPQTPRVSVVYDEPGSTMHEIGREGYAKGGIVGYLELLRKAKAMRDSCDYRHPTVREPQGEWAFRDYVVDATAELAGMTEVPDGPG